MQTIEITISRGEVMEEVAVMSDYLGGKRTTEEAPGAWERLLATDESAEELSRLFDEARVGARAALGRRVVGEVAEGEEPEGGGLSVRVTVADGYDVGATPRVREAVKGYLTGIVLAGWLGICGEGELAQGYAAQGAAALGEGVRLLNERRRARRGSS